MKNKHLAILVITLLCSSFFAVVNVVSAQQTLSGVSKGETFDYDYMITWVSADPSAIPPVEYIEYNNTQQIQLKITDVSGSIVTLDFIRHFKNGTQSVESKTIDLMSGSIEVPYSFVVVGANIAKGQQIYPNGGHQIITDTVTRSYHSGERETNVLSGESSEQKTTIYYDKIKGVTVEYSFTIFENINGYSVNSTELMINTNSDVWAVAQASNSLASPTPTVPEFPLLAVPLLFAAVSAVLLVGKNVKKLPLKL